MPSFTWSTASARVNETTAPFDAQYAARLRRHTSAATDAMLTIAAAARDHGRDHVLAAKEGPARVHGDALLPNAERRLRRAGRRPDACDIDEHVDVMRGSGNLRFVADVQVNVGPGAVRGDDVRALGHE
jgi:hypothetical protein